jgi:hypothetical protein
MRGRSLRFHYKLSRVKQAVVSLGGRWVRPQAIIPVTLIGPTGTVVLDAHLDTGADDTVFPDTVASRAGIDLTNAPIGEAVGIGLNPVQIRYGEVVLRMLQGNERREWRAWAGFCPFPLSRPLLGFAGYLQFFTATFHGDREEVELTVNALYPGT